MEVVEVHKAFLIRLYEPLENKLDSMTPKRPSKRSSSIFGPCHKACAAVSKDLFYF